MRGVKVDVDDENRVLSFSIVSIQAMTDEDKEVYSFANNMGTSITVG